MSSVFSVIRALGTPGVKLSSAERILLVCIANFADLPQGARPSLATLATMTGLGRRSVVRVAGELVAKGWLVKEVRPGVMVTYTIDLSRADQCHGGTSAMVAPVPSATPTSAMVAPDPCHGGTRNSYDPLIETLRGARGGATHPAPGREGNEGRVVATPPPAPPAPPSPPLRLELPAAPSSKPVPKAARPAKPPHPRHREVFQRWLELHEAHYGAPPATGGSEGGRLAKSVSVLLEKFSGDADRVLACLERSVLDRRQPTLHAIALNPEGFRPLAPAKVVPIQPKPGRYTYAGLTDPRQLEAAL